MRFLNKNKFAFRYLLPVNGVGDYIRDYGKFLEWKNKSEQVIKIQFNPA
jgi:hypothetical protein